ncbi:MAG: hypothetical protein JNK33_06785 [Candidatus Doudnabacteria bacterium]|nr:hypothetical protein [Candidatus Doudnabacteria bacterium]
MNAAKLKKAERWAATITDGLGKPIDAGIFETVSALCALNIHTTGSCEGHVGWGIASPWVDILSPAGVQVQDKIMAFRRKTKDKGDIPDHLVRLRDAVISANFSYAEKVLRLLEQFYRGRKTSYECRIIAEYRFDGGARLMCQGAEPNTHRSKTIKQANLKKYQKEFKDFTTFLLTH